jgi:hypothetical protein
VWGAWQPQQKEKERGEMEEIDRGRQNNRGKRGGESEGESSGGGTPASSSQPSCSRPPQIHFATASSAAVIVKTNSVKYIYKLLCKY